MYEHGIFIVGIYIGSETRERETDGVKKLVHYNLVTIGTEPYRIRSDQDYSGRLKFGDEVQFKVRVNAFNGNAYYSGSLFEAEID